MAETPHFFVRGFSAPKWGEERNDDNWGWGKRTGRIAIADGVTVGSFSDTWSSILVRAFIWSLIQFSQDRNRFGRELLRLQKQWHQAVPWDYLERLGWNYLLKARQGTGSTFLGVVLEGCTWNAVAVGDCNLFLVTDGGELQVSWPAKSGDTFHNYPALIPSLPEVSAERIFLSMQRESGEIMPGQSLVLATDALSEHLLSRHSDACLWQELLSLDRDSKSDFCFWINHLRQAGMKNDDTTVVIAEAIASPWI